jgi:hypothetical protein
MIINPCQSCPSHVAAYGEISFDTKFDILYPEINSITNFTSSRNSIEVSLNVSSIGNIYCIALLKDSILTSELIVKQAGYFTTVFDIINASSTIIIIKDLLPSTSYDIYCYTEDFSGHIMPFNAVKNSKMSNINSSCCRELSYTSSFLQINEYSSESDEIENIFEFELDTIPLVTTSVNITLIPYDCGTFINKSIASAIPSDFEFSTSALQLNGRFRVRGTPGCYSQKISVTNGTYYQESIILVKIKSLLEAPDPPQLSSAIFNNDGNKIELLLDSSSDQNRGTFTCSNFLNFSNVNLASCLWASNSLISITLGSSATIEIGDQIELLGGKITALCSIVIVDVCEFSNSSTTTLLAPINPIVPTVSLSTSKVLSTCNDITLDPTRSTGNGGRPWKSIVWSVTDLNNQPESEITSFLNLNYIDNTDGLVIISNNFTQMGTYKISLTLTNFLQKKALAISNTEITPVSSKPYVSISGLSTILTLRKNSISIFAVAKLPACEGVPQDQILYEWELYKGTSYEDSIKSKSRDPRYFKLDPFTLESESLYTAVVTVYSISDSANTASTSVIIQTLKSGVIANLAGGATRTASSSEIITIDASSSYDIGYPTDDTLLSYSWICSEINPYFGASCPSLGVSTTSSVLNIPANQLENGNEAKTYLFTVFVNNIAGSKMSTSAEITVVSDVIPLVSISSSNEKFNSDNKIILSGSISSIGDGFASWYSSNIDESELEIISLTSLTKELKSGTIEYQLAISANSLTSGLTYTFQLGATYGSILPSSTSEYEAVSEIIFSINEAPQSGSMSLSPIEGNASSTEFLFSTKSWTDDGDLPLTYILSYYQLDESSKIIVKGNDENSYVYSKLGQGQSNNNYVITCSAVASDSLGSSSAPALTTIVVLPNEDNQAVAAAAIEDLKKSLKDFNPEGVTQVVGQVMSNLNSVNCSVAQDCASINRKDCSGTAFTCGPCLDDFPLGAHGDANTPCLTLSSRRKLIENVGSTCSFDSDCLSGYCEIIEGVCAYEPKSCSGDCSNNGECLAYNYYNDQINSTSCRANDINCKVSCNCTMNWYGNDCSQNEDDFKSARELRESICVAIYLTLEIQDLSEDVIFSRASSIAEIFQYTTELTDDAISNCSYALTETINLNPDLASSSASTSLKTFSRLLNLNSNQLSKFLLDNVSYSILSLTNGIQSDLAVGEDSYELNEENIRMGVSLVDVLIVSNTTFLTPLTEAEQFDNIYPSSFSFPELLNNTDANSISVSLINYNNNPRDIISDSVTVGMKITEFFSDDSSITTLPLETKILLKNLNPITYYKENLLNGSALCDFNNRLDSIDYNINISCPSDTMYLHCPSNAVNRSYNYICPQRTELPQCTMWDGENFTPNSNCVVNNYDEFSTTCDCTVGTSNRRRLETSSSDLYEFGTSTQTLTTVSTIEFIDPTDSPSFEPTSSPSTNPTSYPTLDLNSKPIVASERINVTVFYILLSIVAPFVCFLLFNRVYEKHKKIKSDLHNFANDEGDCERIDILEEIVETNHIPVTKNINLWDQIIEEETNEIDDDIEMQIKINSEVSNNDIEYNDIYTSPKNDVFDHKSPIQMLSDEGRLNKSSLSIPPRRRASILSPSVKPPVRKILKSPSISSIDSPSTTSNLSPSVKPPVRRQTKILKSPSISSIDNPSTTSNLSPSVKPPVRKILKSQSISSIDGPSTTSSLSPSVKPPVRKILKSPSISSIDNPSTTSNLSPSVKPPVRMIVKSPSISSIDGPSRTSSLSPSVKPPVRKILKSPSISSIDGPSTTSSLSPLVKPPVRRQTKILKSQSISSIDCPSTTSNLSPSVKPPVRKILKSPSISSIDGTSTTSSLSPSVKPAVIRQSMILKSPSISSIDTKDKEISTPIISKPVRIRTKAIKSPSISISDSQVLSSDNSSSTINETKSKELSSISSASVVTDATLNSSQIYPILSILSPRAVSRRKTLVMKSPLTSLSSDQDESNRNLGSIIEEEVDYDDDDVIKDNEVKVTINDINESLLPNIDDETNEIDDEIEIQIKINSEVSNNDIEYNDIYTSPKNDVFDHKSPIQMLSNEGRLNKSSLSIPPRRRASILSPSVKPLRRQTKILKSPSISSIDSPSTTSNLSPSVKPPVRKILKSQSISSIDGPSTTSNLSPLVKPPVIRQSMKLKSPSISSIDGPSTTSNLSPSVKPPVRKILKSPSISSIDGPSTTSSLSPLVKPPVRRQTMILKSQSISSIDTKDKEISTPIVSKPVRRRTMIKSPSLPTIDDDDNIDEN